MRSSIASLAVVLVAAAFVPALGAQAQTTATDITVTDVGWDQLQLGEDTIFQATIENQGEADRTDPFDVRLHLEDASFDETVTVEELEAGGSVEVSAPEPWRAEAGSYTFNATAQVDESFAFDDRNANNDRNRSFELGQGPDIVLDKVRVEPTTPVADDEVTFVAHIENVAPDEHDIDDPFVVEFQIREDGDVVDTLTTDPIEQLRAMDPQQVTSHDAWTAEDGSYTVVAEADPAQNISEVEEENNEAERAFNVKPAEPDLVLTHLAPAEDRPSPGEDIAIEATIENQGTADVENDFPVRFRINGTTYGADVSAGIDDGLAPGTDVTVTSEDWTVQEGHHELEAIADPGHDNVDESNHDNNQRATSLHVGPDLVIADILWTPDPPAAESEVTLEPRVLNQGTADIEENTTIQVSIPSEDETWTGEIGPLEAGNSTQITVGTWQPPANATYDIEAEADVDDDADEIDDGNNARTESIVVTQPRADLVATALDPDPDKPASGEETTFEATITNEGSADAEEIEVAFRVDGEPLGERKTIAGGQFEQLEPGESAQVTSDAWTPGTGQHEVTVHADPDDDVTEIQDDNNDRTSELLVGPDARIADIERSPEDAEAGDTVSFAITAANAGSEPIGELPVRVLVDGDAIGNATLEDLGPDEEDTFEVSWTAEAGDHTVRAIADPDDTVTEAREDDNEREESFSTTATPDLQVTSIRWSEDPAAGDELVFTAQITNTGTAAIQGSFTTTFHIDGETIGSATIDGLDTDSSQSVSSEAWPASAGSHTIRVVADADDAVNEEAGEDNNQRTASVTVASPSEDDDANETGPPNLVVSGISPPEDIGPGDEVTFLATIKNEGGQEAEASQARILVDGELVGEPSIGALTSGKSISVTSESWNATQGEHTVTVVADVLDDVEESDEEDNERVKQIAIGNVTEEDPQTEAGIALGPGATTGPVQAGVSTQLTVEVTNRGEDATDVTVDFYVDGTRLGDATLTGLDPGETAELEGPEWEPTPGEHTLTARSGDAQTETLVEATEEASDAPAPGVALLALVFALAGAIARREAGT